MKLKDIGRVFSTGERKTFAQLAEMIEMGRRANVIMVQMMTPGPSSTLTAPNEDMRLLEKQADQVSFKIKQHIMNGAVNPKVLDGLLECVDLADSMIDEYYFSSRELNRMSKVRFHDDSFSSSSSSQAPDIAPLLVKSLDFAEKAMEVLLKMVRSTDLAEIVELRADIELIEEEGDNIKDEGFDRLYASAPDMHYLQFMHLSVLLHKFDDVLDSCENLADRIVSIMTGVSK